jgi:hypothetical protein
MIGTPLLLAVMAEFGIARGLALAGAASLVVVLPVVVFVFKQSPESVGLLPDGAEASTGSVTNIVASWSRGRDGGAAVRFADDRVRPGSDGSDRIP